MREQPCLVVGGGEVAARKCALLLRAGARVTVVDRGTGRLDLGSGRGGKPKDERLGPAALAHHQGRRARKGRKVEGFPKPARLLPG